MRRTAGLKQPGSEGRRGRGHEGRGQVGALPDGRGALQRVTGGVHSQSGWGPGLGRPWAVPSARLRPAAAVQSPAAEGWQRDASKAGKLAEVRNRGSGLALWGRLRRDPDASEGKWRPRRAHVGLGRPGAAACRRAVVQEAQALRGPRLGRHRPPLAPSDGAELGSKRGPAVGGN